MLKKTIAFGLTAFLFLGTPAHSQELTGDFDGDGRVGFLDFITFASGFGKRAGEPGFDDRLDLDGNGRVDFPDFILFAQAFAAANQRQEPVSTLLYVADLLGHKIDAIDTETNLFDLTRRIRVSEPRGIAFSSKNARIYVASIDSFHSVFEDGARHYSIPLLDPPAQPGGRPETRAGGSKVALSPDHRYAFVTEEFAGQVEVVDLSAAQSIRQIPVGPAPVGIVVSNDGTEVYVGHYGRAISVIDGVRHTFKDSIQVGGLVDPRRLAISPDGARIYLATYDGSEVRLIALDPRAGEVVASLPVGEPGDVAVFVKDLAVSGRTGFLHATLQREVPRSSNPVTPGFVGELVVIDPVSFEAVAKVTVAEIVANLAVTADGKTAYVGGIAQILEVSQKIFIVDLENSAVVGSLPGFDLPADLKFKAGKPVVSGIRFPEISLF